MKLIKAIEILSSNGLCPNETTWGDYLKAVKLGIEALTYIGRLRACSFEHRQARLPSETPADYHPNTSKILKRLRESPLGREPRG